MMVPILIMVVMVAVSPVSAAFRLEGSLNYYQVSSETKEHILDHMVGSNTKDLLADFGRQMPISEMPGEANKLIAILMPDFEQKFGRGLDQEPCSIFELQTIAIGHRNCVRKVEKDVLTLICSQTNATAMARVKIEGERARSFFLGPMPGGSMNGSTRNGSILRSHIST
jgi:hypothetical protein